MGFNNSQKARIRNIAYEFRVAAGKEFESGNDERAIALRKYADALHALADEAPDIDKPTPSCRDGVARG